MSSTRLIAGSLLLLFLQACTSLPDSAQSMAKFESAQRGRAVELEEQNAIVQALNHWHLLQLLQPENGEYAERVVQLESEIEHRQRLAREGGRAAFQKGNQKLARSSYMKVLALKPGDSEAVNRLRELHLLSARTVQAAKAERETGPDENRLTADKELLDELARLLNNKQYEDILKISSGWQNVASDERLLEPVYLSYIALAGQHLKNNEFALALDQLQSAEELGYKTEDVAERISRLRRLAAKQYIQQGQRQLRSDIDQAIVLFRQAVTFDSDYALAQQQLDKAVKMQANLRKIGAKR